MNIKKQSFGLSGCFIALVLLSTNGVNADSNDDENSLESRLKAFNAPDATLDKAYASSDAKTQKKVKVAKPKAKVAKRKRYKRACYQSSTATLLERAKSLQPAIRNSSYRYGVSEALIISVITAESCFARHARSPKNARGLMQLIPATAKRFGVKNAYIPSENIKGGTRYLKFLLERFSGNLHLTIAAYNAGEGAVDRYSGIPPYRETKEYVRRVMSVYRRLQKSMGATIVSRGKEIDPGFNQKLVKASAKKSNKMSLVAEFYRVSKSQKRPACRDVSSLKLKKNSWLVKRDKSMKRYYSSGKPQSLSSISKVTGVTLNLLLRMNRTASRYRVKPGSKILVWQCANR